MMNYSLKMSWFLVDLILLFFEVVQKLLYFSYLREKNFVIVGLG